MGGVSVTSVTFISAEEGWVIGTVPGADPLQSLLFRTQDGGMHWTKLVSPPGNPTIIRFGNAMDGYATEGSLGVDTTTDGGQTWMSAKLPYTGGGIGGESLEITDATVWLFGSSPDPIIYRTRLGSAAFTRVGYAGDRGASLAVQGGEAYVLGEQGAGPIAPNLEVATTTGLSKRALPCQGVTSPTGDAGAITPLAGPMQLVVACDPESSPTRAATASLFRSGDDGKTWKSFAQLAGCSVDSLTRTSTEVFAACAAGGIQRVPLAGGATVTSLPGSGFSYVGFTNDTDGVAILARTTDTGPGAVSQLEVTRDAGYHWAIATF